MTSICCALNTTNVAVGAAVCDTHKCVFVLKSDGVVRLDPYSECQ